MDRGPYALTDDGDKPIFDFLSFKSLSQGTPKNNGKKTIAIGTVLSTREYHDLIQIQNFFRIDHQATAIRNCIALTGFAEKLEETDAGLRVLDEASGKHVPLYQELGIGRYAHRQEKPQRPTDHTPPKK